MVSPKEATQAGGEGHYQGGREGGLRSKQGEVCTDAIAALRYRQIVSLRRRESTLRSGKGNSIALCHRHCCYCRCLNRGGSGVDKHLPTVHSPDQLSRKVELAVVASTS